jgi:hypothetical protein
MPDEVHLMPMSPKHPKIQGQKHSQVSSSKHLILRNKDTILQYINPKRTSNVVVYKS